MSETATEEELLQACVQDLHAARLLAAKRLAGLRDAAGQRLAALLEELAAGYRAEAGRFEATDISLEGPENLWMAGIMDDAERDTRSIARGPLLDTALIGAVRKAVMADAVSLETAVVVARALGRSDIADLADAMRQSAGEHDDRLRSMLQEIG